MSIRSKLISDALTERFRELCDERIPGLGLIGFGCEVMPLVDRVRESLYKASPTALSDAARGIKWPDEWSEPGQDYPTTFRPYVFAIALGPLPPLHAVEHPPIESAVELLNAPGFDSEQRVRLLMYRYSCPLNFTLPEEAEVRELLLRRLMTRDRSLVEKGATQAVNADELLLMLNLVAVHALREPDLRFLDALNYYYELLPVRWYENAHEQGVLLASYFALYAHALAAWIREDN
ncbi:MAG TPA: hypothetical protein VM095_16710 [Pyrinomonadaceae bacterium]|nr:hypothetical protein [Pyrinomonadaceae bacterium]